MKKIIQRNDKQQMAMIEIEGKKYKVIETLPYHQAGHQAKAVQTEGGEKIAVKRGGRWTWWRIEDRMYLPHTKINDELQRGNNNA